MGFSRQESWSGLPFPSPVDHILSNLSTMTHMSWVAPRTWLSFIELDKAVALVWLDWLVFCEYGFSVFALWCPLATSTILFGFLLPWAWDTSSQLLQQSAAIAPYLGRGVSPHCRPSWPSTCDSSSRPSCARAATAQSRNITLLMNVYLVKAMDFSLVMYGCGRWTIKKAEHWRIDALNHCVGEDSWESLKQQRNKTSQS